MSYSLKALNDAVRSDPKGYAEECDAIFAQKVENAAKRIADHRSESHVILLSGTRLPSSLQEVNVAMAASNAMAPR